MTFLDQLRASGIIAIVRGADSEASLQSVLALVQEGISIVEVSLTTPDAERVIAEARQQLGPDAHLGAGTVLTAADVARSADAGATFVVTPGLGPSLAAATQRGLPVIAGALTPSEVISSMYLGATAVKLFPASLGGLRYLRALHDPFPDVPFVPVGGVDAAAAREYLAAGALAVGVGSPLVGDAASGGDQRELRIRARQLRALVDEVHGR